MDIAGDFADFARFMFPELHKRHPPHRAPADSSGLDLLDLRPADVYYSS